MAKPNPPQILELRRVFDAPRERVFRALTDLEQIRKWWGPGGFTLPEAQQEFRVGGRYRFAMRSPEGRIHHLKGEYREIQPPTSSSSRGRGRRTAPFRRRWSPSI